MSVGRRGSRDHAWTSTSGERPPLRWGETPPIAPSSTPACPPSLTPAGVKNSERASQDAFLQRLTENATPSDRGVAGRHRWVGELRRRQVVAGHEFGDVVAAARPAPAGVVGIHLVIGLAVHHQVLDACGGGDRGGIRVPFLAKWSGVLPRGKVYAWPVSSTDGFATAAAVAQRPVPDQHPVDGANLLPHFRGKSKNRPHDQLSWRLKRRRRASRRLETGTQSTLWCSAGRLGTVQSRR